MVSEGVDIPRLQLAVFATTTTTELFFRQAVGRVVRWIRGAGRQKAYVFLPDDPRLARHAAAIAESRRHNLRRRAERDVVRAEDPEGALDEDAEQLSMFAVIGSVATEAGDAASRGVFGRDPDDPEDTGSSVDHREPAGVELLLHPPPLPSGAAGVIAGPGDGAPGDGEQGRPVPLRERKAAVRQANADLAVEIVRSTGWGHAQVNRELNRLAGIDRIGEATLGQLERRLSEGRRWLRST